MVDQLIFHGTLRTMDTQRRLLSDSAVAIEKGQILDIGNIEELSSKYTARKVIDAQRKVVIPVLK
jgi:predicted amidohydrolase YtcJ